MLNCISFLYICLHDDHLLWMTGCVSAINSLSYKHHIRSTIIIALCNFFFQNSRPPMENSVDPDQLDSDEVS